MTRAGFAVFLVLAASGTRADISIGQWVWCEADGRHFDTALARDPSLVPGVLAATVGVEKDVVRLRLGLRPGSVAGRDGTAIVVRFEDGFHAVLGSARSAAALDRLASDLHRLVEKAEAGGTRVVEIQLDYDCPQSKLDRWAGFLTTLTSGPLRGRQVWITSVPAHMEVARYGDLFRDVVAGHVLQVFDTGLVPTAANARRLARLTDEQDMPFRLGVGAFERSPAADANVGWFDHLDLFTRAAGFGGVWVFPGGMPWTPALAPLLRAVGR